ncbi:hypothetical protein D3C71_1558240 [compost metagenome]
MEQSEKLSETRKQLDELNVQIREQRLAYQKEINDLKAVDQKERKREQEEYQYNFERQKRQAKDSLDDEIAARRKEFEEEVEDKQEQLDKYEHSLDIRANELRNREDKIEELENKVAEFPVREAQIRKEADEAARKDEQRTTAIKESYIKRDYESKAAVLENKIQLLEGSLEAEKVRSSELAQKLDEAYNKIQAMALKSVESTNESKAISQLQGLISNNQK